MTQPTCFQSRFSIVFKQTSYRGTLTRQVGMAGRLVSKTFILEAFGVSLATKVIMFVDLLAPHDKKDDIRLSEALLT